MICGSRFSVRIPDAPVDQWEVAECVQDHSPLPPYMIGLIHDSGDGTRWVELPYGEPSHEAESC